MVAPTMDTTERGGESPIREEPRPRWPTFGEEERAAVEDGKVVEDVVALTVTFEHGTPCTVVSDFYSGESADAFRVVGTEGRIETDALDDGTFGFETGTVSGTLTFDGPATTHGGLIDHVETVLLDGGENRSSGRDAVLTEAVLDDGVRSAHADALPEDRWEPGPRDFAALRSM